MLKTLFKHFFKRVSDSFINMKFTDNLFAMPIDKIEIVYLSLRNFIIYKSIVFNFIMLNNN